MDTSFVTVHFVHSNLQRTEADPLPRATHLKGIEPPHMVPETTALSTELQVHNEKHNFKIQVWNYQSRFTLFMILTQNHEIVKIFLNSAYSSHILK